MYIHFAPTGFLYEFSVGFKAYVAPLIVFFAQHHSFQTHCSALCTMKTPTSLTRSRRNMLRRPTKLPRRPIQILKQRLMPQEPLLMLVPAALQCDADLYPARRSTITLKAKNNMNVRNVMDYLRNVPSLGISAHTQVSLAREATMAPLRAGTQLSTLRPCFKSALRRTQSYLVLEYRIGPISIANTIVCNALRGHSQLTLLCRGTTPFALADSYRVLHSMTRKELFDTARRRVGMYRWPAQTCGDQVHVLAPTNNDNLQRLALDVQSHTVYTLTPCSTPKRKRQTCANDKNCGSKRARLIVLAATSA